MKWSTNTAEHSHLGGLSKASGSSSRLLQEAQNPRPFFKSPDESVDS